MMSILIPSGVFLAAYWVRYYLLTTKYGRKLPLILPLAFTCLFIPKITLIQINPDHSMAGIRTDDILTLVMLLISLRDAYTWKNKRFWLVWDFCWRCRFQTSLRSLSGGPWDTTTRFLSPFCSSFAGLNTLRLC